MNIGSLPRVLALNCDEVCTLLLLNLKGVI
jgi:hypothetical protein